MAELTLAEALAVTVHQVHVMVFRRPVDASEPLFFGHSFGHSQSPISLRATRDVDQSLYWRSKAQSSHWASKSRPPDGAQGALGRSQRGGSVQGHYLICAPSGAHSVSLRFTPRAPLGNILKPWEEWYRGRRPAIRSSLAAGAAGPVLAGAGAGTEPGKAACRQAARIAGSGRRKAVGGEERQGAPKWPAALPPLDHWCDASHCCRGRRLSLPGLRWALSVHRRCFHRGA